MKKVNSKTVRGSAKADRTPAQSTGRKRSGAAARILSAAIVGVGASAGGLEAFTALLKHLPADSGLGFVLVQHLDPQHESALTQLLTRASVMPVREVTNNVTVEPNHVYVIPPNRTLSIAQGRLKLAPRDPRRQPTRSIDSFFESLAQDQRERAIGVILSGTATDGTIGLEAIKAEGGITFAQDESAKYDSMPRSAVAAGCVDFVLDPKAIAIELVRIAKHPYVVSPPPEPLPAEADRATATAHEDDETALPSGGHGAPRTEVTTMRRAAEADELAGEHGYKKILLLLRNHSGADFSLYKSTTIQRRITRRMVLSKHDTLNSYANFLRGNRKELDALYSDVLISVTSFFRNPEAFEVLKAKIFPKFLHKRGDDPLRVWVLGCSTGQEAYSIAMAFLESAEQVPRTRAIQIFATDLNDALLDKARQGLYAKTLAQDVSPERLRRFFVEEEGGYRVVKPLREMVVFARQNLISDPPFSRMDLISCRNLLIYLEPSLQKQAMPTFHYALKPGGFLFLGASESIGAFTDLFEPADKKHKIYVKKAAPTSTFHLPLKRDRAERPSPDVKPPLRMEQGRGTPPEEFRTELSSQREADRVTVNQFAPPGVLINADLQVLQFRGPTSAYLQPPSTGKASFDILKMAREGLLLPLRAAINQAKRENQTARKERVRVQQDGAPRTVNLEVIPLKNLRERCYLILFEDAEQPRRRLPERIEARGKVRTVRAVNKREESRRADALDTELSETRDYLQAIQEQYEAANEELQASNEEVQSANEELQSINEELETSKEELESANEELTTVNEEMSSRNLELSRLNADLTNLHVSVNMPILVFARDLTIRRFTAQAARIFNLLATDIGRPASGIRHNLVVPTLPGARSHEASQGALSSDPGAPAPFPVEELLRAVVDTVSVREHEAADRDGRRYVLRARPYMTADNKVDGAVLALLDVTDLKHSEEDAKVARNYAEATIRTARDPVVILRADLRVNTANDAFYRTFKTVPGETEGRLIYELGEGQWKIPELRRLLEEILPRDTVFNDFEVTHEFPHIGRRTLLLNARRLDLNDGMPPLILLAFEDVTERQRTETAVAALAAIVNFSDDAIISKDLQGAITSWNKGAETLFGYTSQEAVGRPVSMLLPPDRIHEGPDILARITRGERVEHFQTVRLRKNHTPVDISLTVSPIKDASGHVIGASKIAHDITDLKRALEDVRLSEIRYRRLFEAAHDGVLIVDSVTHRITDANPFMTTLLGFARDELLGKELWHIGLLRDERAAHAAFRELQEKGVIRYEDLPLLSKSGEPREVEVVANRYDEAGRQVIQCNIRDISERKRAEKALAQIHAQLESQAEELIQFNRAAVGRELRMIELKKEINTLCQRQGEPARYPLEFEQGEKAIDG